MGTNLVAHIGSDAVDVDVQLFLSAALHRVYNQPISVAGQLTSKLG